MPPNRYAQGSRAALLIRPPKVAENLLLYKYDYISMRLVYKYEAVRVV